MDIDYDYYSWGPYLFKSRVPDEIIAEIMDKSTSLEKSHNSKLASCMSITKVFDDDNRVWLCNVLSPWFKTYFETVSGNLSIQIDDFNAYEMPYAWANFQRQHEPNTEHVHGGDISFVLYLDIPRELKEENSIYQGTSAGPGGVTFRYGESQKFSRSTHSFFPEEGFIYIFPAYLSHWVIPFKSDCIRVSVSGNVKCLQL